MSVKMLIGPLVALVATTALAQDTDKKECWYPDAVDKKYERQMSKRATKKLKNKKLSTLEVSAIDKTCEADHSACFLMERTQLSGLSGDFRAVKYRLCVKHTDGVIQEAQHIEIEQMP